jgi:hypothetical protein
MITYFKITSGPVFEFLQAFVAERHAADDAMRQWIKANDLPVDSFRGKAVKFLAVITPNPKLWRRVKGGFYKPSRRTKKGMALADELDKLPVSKGAVDLLIGLSDLVGGSDLMMINSLGRVALRSTDECTAFKLSIDPYWLPESREGMTEITATEFAA